MTGRKGNSIRYIGKKERYTGKDRTGKKERESKGKEKISHELMNRKEHRKGHRRKRTEDNYNYVTLLTPCNICLSPFIRV